MSLASFSAAAIVSNAMAFSKYSANIFICLSRASLRGLMPSRTFASYVCANRQAGQGRKPRWTQRRGTRQQYDPAHLSNTLGNPSASPPRKRDHPYRFSMCFFYVYRAVGSQGFPLQADLSHTLLTSTSLQIVRPGHLSLQANLFVVNLPHSGSFQEAPLRDAAAPTARLSVTGLPQSSAFVMSETRSCG